MRLYQFIQYALRKRFTINFSHQRGPLLLYNIKVNPEKKDIEPLKDESGPQEIAKSINLSGFSKIFDIHETAINKRRIINEFEEKIPKDTTEKELDEVFEQLLSSETYLLEILNFFEKYKAVIAKNDEDSMGLKNLYLSFYYDKDEFNQLNGINFRDMVKALSYLPTDPFSDLIKIKFNDNLEKLEFYNFSGITTLTADKLKLFLEVLAEKRNEEKLKSLWNSIISPYGRIFDVYLTIATAEQISAFYDILDEQLSVITKTEWDTFLAERLWAPVFSNKNREEVYKAIQALAPRIKQNNDKRFYSKRQPYPGKVNITPHESVLKGPILHAQDTYKMIYGDEEPRSKLREVICQLAVIMHNPALVVALLQSFDHELKKAWEEEFKDQAVSEILPQTKTVHIENMPWKIPEEKSNFKTNRFLTRQIIAFLQKHGFAKNIYKATYFIDEKRFMDLIESGDFFSEGALNPYFLTHGKVIHNLTRIMIILAWELGLLPHKEEVSPKDIFKEMSDLKIVPNLKMNLWSYLNDMGPTSGYHFNDPHLFHSLLMSACEDSLPYLSALITHSFCKDLEKMRIYIEESRGIDLTIPKLVDLYIAPRVLYAIRDLEDETTHTIEKYLNNKNKLGASTGSLHLYHFKTKFDRTEAKKEVDGTRSPSVTQTNQIT